MPFSHKDLIQEIRQILLESPLPGFKRLQRRYQIEVEGEPTIVLIEEMSVEQLRDKLRELRGMHSRLSRHIEEMERYIEMREAGQAA